jgi:hypothetical protein
MSEDASFSACEALRSLCSTLRLEDFEVASYFPTIFYLFRNDSNLSASRDYTIIYDFLLPNLGLYKT